MRNPERSLGAALTGAGLLLVLVMTIALGVVGGAGIWIVAVAGGLVLGFLIALGGVGIVGVSRSIRRQERGAFVDPLAGPHTSHKLFFDLRPGIAGRRR